MKSPCWMSYHVVSCMLIAAGCHLGVALANDDPPNNASSTPDATAAHSQSSIDVPQLVGLSFDEARRKLEDKGLRIKLNPKNKGNSSGTIQSQIPPQGRRVLLGSFVTVTLAVTPAANNSVLTRGAGDLSSAGARSPSPSVANAAPSRSTVTKSASPRTSTGAATTVVPNHRSQGTPNNANAVSNQPSVARPPLSAPAVAGLTTMASNQPARAGVPELAPAGGSAPLVSGSAPVTSAAPLPASELQATGSPPPSEFKSVDDALARMVHATAVFSTPETIDFDSSCPCPVELVLDAHKTFSQLAGIIKDSDPSAANFHGGRVQISNSMIARLSAPPDDFIIEPAGDQQQAVSYTVPTMWHWTVTPKTWGKHSLHVELNAIVTIDGHPGTRQIRTFDREIEVYVSMTSLVWHFVQAYWQWIWAALLIPVVKFLMDRRKKRVLARSKSHHQAPGVVQKRAKGHK